MLLQDIIAPSTNSFKITWWFNTFTPWSLETSTAISVVFWPGALGSQHHDAWEVDNAPDSLHKKLAKYLTLENHHFGVQLQPWGLDSPIQYTFVTHPPILVHRKGSHKIANQYQCSFLRAISFDLMHSDNHNHIVTCTQTIQWHAKQLNRKLFP